MTGSDLPAPSVDELMTTFNRDISVLEKFLLEGLKLEQLPNNPVHRFADGLYCRELTMPKDSLWTSRVHKFGNITSILSGRVTVCDRDGIHEYVAPCTMVTTPGIKRLLIIREESTWVTVHRLPDGMGPDTDIGEIEDYFACDTIEQYEYYLENQRREQLT